MRRVHPYFALPIPLFFLFLREYARMRRNVVVTWPMVLMKLLYRSAFRVDCLLTRMGFKGPDCVYTNEIAITEFNAFNSCEFTYSGSNLYLIRICRKTQFLTLGY